MVWSETVVQLMHTQKSSSSVAHTTWDSPFIVDTASCVAPIWNPCNSMFSFQCSDANFKLFLCKWWNKKMVWERGCTLVLASFPGHSNPNPRTACSTGWKWGGTFWEYMDIYTSIQIALLASLVSLASLAPLAIQWKWGDTAASWRQGRASMPSLVACSTKSGGKTWKDLSRDAFRCWRHLS